MNSQKVEYPSMTDNFVYEWIDDDDDDEKERTNYLTNPAKKQFAQDEDFSPFTLKCEPFEETQQNLLAILGRMEMKHDYSGASLRRSLAIYQHACFNEFDWVNFYENDLDVTKLYGRSFADQIKELYDYTMAYDYDDDDRKVFVRMLTALAWNRKLKFDYEEDEENKND